MPKAQKLSLRDQLAGDLRALLINKRLTDTRVDISGKDLQLHRFMLLARWPKLLELCEGDKPLQFNVFLGERGAELLDNVMQFLYTDQLSVFRKFDLETLFEVLEFAQATDFKQLVRACEYTISTRARVDTIAEIKARAASAPPLLAWYIH